MLTVCSQKAGYAWGLLPASTLQAVAPVWLPWPLQCHSGRVERDCLVFTLMHVWAAQLLAAAGIETAAWSFSLLVACICECHALLPVLMLLLPQASLVPAST